ADMSPNHTDVVNLAVDATMREFAENGSEKFLKLGTGHFAGGHGEFAMSELAEPGNVAVNGTL
ncbi:MAG: hypothetical protein ACR2O0_15560, partial [Rhizobiaceae bacterium]